MSQMPSTIKAPVRPIVISHPRFANGFRHVRKDFHEARVSEEIVSVGRDPSISRTWSDRAGQLRLEGFLAVADAVVMNAGLEAPNFCPQLNRTVQALLVVLVHTASTGELYASIYGHLSRIDVQVGASVSEGTVIGLSGNTGCSGTPHLHFGIGRSVAGRYVLIDPYGWHAPTGDPWELDPRGAASVWLWKDGAAPSLR